MSKIDMIRLWVALRGYEMADLQQCEDKELMYLHIGRKKVYITDMIREIRSDILKHGTPIVGHTRDFNGETLSDDDIEYE